MSLGFVLNIVFRTVNQELCFTIMAVCGQYFWYITEAPPYTFMAFTGTTLLLFVIFVLCLHTGGMVTVAFEA
jgi:hypothetical protein